MKFIVYSFLLLSPVYLLNNVVMPELDKMQHFYMNIDSIAEKAVAGQSTK